MIQAGNQPIRSSAVSHAVVVGFADELLEALVVIGDGQFQ